MSEKNYSTFAEILEKRAETDKVAYTFIEIGGKSRRKVTYKELHHSAKIIAKKLKETHAPQSRILLLYSSSAEFIKSFFGCIYAGMVAVPAYPPHPALMNRMLPRILTVISESDSNTVLSDLVVFEDMKKARTIPELSQMSWLQTDTLDFNENTESLRFEVDRNALALIQYSSGSTGTPKGVMISNYNLVHNCSLLNYCGINDSDIGVTWTPVYHDMGLIFGMLCPIYCGFPMTVMSPIDFLTKPVMWLQEMTNIKATITCAPTFAYDICSRKVTDEQIKSLDLSSLTAVVVSAEPVRAESLERFSNRFKSCGYSPTVFHPAYGMAETTLVISSMVGRLKEPTEIVVEREELEENKISFAKSASPTNCRLVSSGPPINDMSIRIVNPDTKEPLSDGMIGEVWVSGPSVAMGYWKRPEDTEKEFRAKIVGDDTTPYLRTGDLGCMLAGELYITGRLKDMIIVRGRNYYPQDIESAVEKANAPIRPGCVSAFAVDEGGEEKIIVVAEVERKRKINMGSPMHKMGLKIRSLIPGFNLNEAVEFNRERAIQEIKNQIAESTEINVSGIILIEPGSLRKTSSGKVQRKAMKELYLKKQLKVVHAWMSEELNI